MSYKTQKKQHEKWVDNIEIVYAVVAGSDDFPFDMLRFDCCYPQDCNDREQFAHRVPFGKDVSAGFARGQEQTSR